jgi:hypothetical protein
MAEIGEPRSRDPDFSPSTQHTEPRPCAELQPGSPDFDQTTADKAKNRIKQALGEIGCDVFIETDR